MPNIVFYNKEEILKSFIFKHENPKKDTYRCKCGNVINKSNTIDESQKINVKFDNNAGLDVSDVYLAASTQTGIVCNKCEADFDMPEHISTIHASDKYFLETFSFVENDDRLFLYKTIIQCHYNNEKFSLKDKKSYISINKADKKLYYKSFDSEEEMDFTLDGVIKVVSSFFVKSRDAAIIDNLFEVHKFLNRLANFVSDSKNIDIINGLMKEMIGKSGVLTLAKVACIFLGIMAYPNLSTIAMTKGTVFLYDLMSGCNLPKPNELSENDATSPIKIFNFLVNLENAEIQKEIDSQDHSKQKFIYWKDKKIELKNVNLIEGYDNAEERNIVKNSSAGIIVRDRDDIVDKSVSPYIFKNIQRFSDYKLLMKYTKFIKYNDLIDFCMKYDTDLLINTFPLIEFRADINTKLLTQFFRLIISFLEDSSVDNYKLLSNNITIIHTNDSDASKGKNFKDLKLDYSIIPHRFTFAIYDDCIRMINSLKWDTTKEFVKIRKFTELVSYHDQLVSHFNMLTNKEKYEEFSNFISQYSYLEKYKGPLDVKIIRTPDEVLRQAIEMKNCSASYVDRICNKKYILLIVNDKSKRIKPYESVKFMFGLHVNNMGLEFDAVKASCNKVGVNRFKKQMKTYLRSKNIMYRETNDLLTYDNELTLGDQIKKMRAVALKNNIN